MMINQLPTGTVVIPEDIDQLLREESEKKQETNKISKIQHLLTKGGEK